MKFLSFLLIVVLLFSATSCGQSTCTHAWTPATCKTPPTCSICNAVSGETLEHTWTPATCETPPTCSICNTVFGKPLEHTWIPATCTKPKTCSVCNAVSGETLEHTWAPATCLKPKTCSVCNTVSGETAGHTWKAATCTTPKTCSVCNTESGKALGHTTGSSTCSRCGKNLSVWEIGEYVDEFKQPIGKKYMVTYAQGTFSNSATTNSTLLVAVQIDKDQIGFTLAEYGKHIVKGTTSYETYNITILDQKGTKHSLTGTLYKGNTRINVDNSSKSAIINLLRNNETLTIYLKTSKYTISTYLFTLDTTGFSTSYNSIK